MYIGNLLKISYTTVNKLVFENLITLFFIYSHKESHLAQLHKVSSVQSLQSPKKKYESSTILGELHLPLTLGPRFVGSANVLRIQKLYYRTLPQYC